jgi:acetyltransferase-like isoleucine patch superfamily enzyme
LSSPPDAPTRRDVMIVGAGKLGAALYDCLEGDPGWNVVGFIDDAKAGETLFGVPICDSHGFEKLGCERALPAIGLPTMRKAFVEKLSGRGLQWATYIDRRSHVSRAAIVGEGSCVLPFASIGPGVELGAFSYLGVYASAGAGARLGPFSTLLPRASVGGGEIGACCILGMNSACLEGASLGDHVHIAPYSWFRKSAPSHSFISGNPARVIRRTQAECEVQ